MTNTKKALRLAVCLTTLLVVSGCSRVEMIPTDLDEAREMCKDNGGVKLIKLESFMDDISVNNIFVVCDNGMRGSYKASKRNDN